MSSTHLSLHYHLVFATKNRQPTIAVGWCGKLHVYLGGITRGLGAVPEEIGGVADHVHLLIGANATHRLSDLMREIKSESSRWVHEEIGVASFAWQEGYGAFTVSASQREAVRHYIQTQEDIIAVVHSAKNISSCCNGLASPSMNDFSTDELLPPRRGGDRASIGFRGFRGASPPANFFQPSGLGSHGFIVRDLPWTEKKLRELPPFEFENWAVIALGGRKNKAQVGDKESAAASSPSRRWITCAWPKQTS